MPDGNPSFAPHTLTETWPRRAALPWWRIETNSVSLPACKVCMDSSRLSPSAAAINSSKSLPAGAWPVAFPVHIRRERELAFQLLRPGLTIRSREVGETARHTRTHGQAPLPWRVKASCPGVDGHDPYDQDCAIVPVTRPATASAVWPRLRWPTRVSTAAQ